MVTAASSMPGIMTDPTGRSARCARPHPAIGPGRPLRNARGHYCLAKDIAHTRRLRPADVERPAAVLMPLADPPAVDGSHQHVAVPEPAEKHPLLVGHD